MAKFDDAPPVASMRVFEPNNRIITKLYPCCVGVSLVYSPEDNQNNLILLSTLQLTQAQLQMFHFDYFSFD